MIGDQIRVHDDARLDKKMPDAAAERIFVTNFRREPGGNRFIDKADPRADANILPEHGSIIDKINALDCSDRNSGLGIGSRDLLIFQIFLIHEFVGAGIIRIEPHFILCANTTQKLSQRIDLNSLGLLVAVELILSGRLCASDKGKT